RPRGPGCAPVCGRADRRGRAKGPRLAAGGGPHRPGVKRRAARGGPAAPADPAAARRRGLDFLENLLLNLVHAGQWFTPAWLLQLEKDAEVLGEALLPGARVTLRRLVQCGRAEGLADDERLAEAADLVARLWAMVQRGRLYLDGKRAEGETAAEADAGRAEVFGQAHQPEDPRARDLSLLELAYERVDDWPSGERVETSHLLDLEGGAV